MGPAILETPEIVGKVGAYLQQALPLAQEDLELHVIGLEALRYNLAEEVANSKQLLYEKRKQALWPKDAEKGLTELDRTTRLNGDIAPYERQYHFLSRLEELVDGRLELAQQFLS